MRYKKTYSRTAKREYAIMMEEINVFCDENNIINSTSNDSYYFEINGQEYRVSNHAVESRNKYDEITGELKNARGYELDTKRDKKIIYIHASKTRIREIYSDLINGYELDGRGYRKKA